MPVASLQFAPRGGLNNELEFHVPPNRLGFKRLALAEGIYRFECMPA